MKKTFQTIKGYYILFIRPMCLIVMFQIFRDSLLIEILTAVNSDSLFHLGYI